MGNEDGDEIVYNPTVDDLLLIHQEISKDPDAEPGVENPDRSGTSQLFVRPVKSD